MRVFVTEKFLFIKEQLYAQFFGAVEIFFLKRVLNRNSRFEFSYNHFTRFLLGYNCECDDRDLQ